VPECRRSETEGGRLSGTARLVDNRPDAFVAPASGIRLWALCPFSVTPSASAASRRGPSAPTKAVAYAFSERDIEPRLTQVLAAVQASGEIGAISHKI
jgi:hypothetical protein